MFEGFSLVLSLRVTEKEGRKTWHLMHIKWSTEDFFLCLCIVKA